MAMHGAVLPFYSEHRSHWGALVNAAISKTSSRLYLWFTGDSVSAVATADLLEDIAKVFRPVALHNPRLDVVPLLPCASWSAEHVASIPDMDSVFISSQSHTDGLVQQLNARRDPQLVRLQAVQLPPTPAGRSAGDSSSSTEAAGGSVEAVGASSRAPLAFEHVAVGGTFDRLHVGHRLLLAATALVTTERVYIGVTGDQLLAKKSHRELLESYEQRAAAAEGYLRAVRPGLTVQTGALLDPKEPTAAATEAGMQALVVSKETIPGAEAINQYRKEHGYAPLTVIVVDVISDTRAVAGGKVSSTALREQDAQRLQQAGEAAGQ